MGCEILVLGSCLWLQLEVQVFVKELEFSTTGEN